MELDYDMSQEAKARRALEFKQKAKETQGDMMAGIMGGFLAKKEKKPDPPPPSTTVPLGADGGDFGDFGDAPGDGECDDEFGDFGSMSCGTGGMEEASGGQGDGFGAFDTPLPAEEGATPPGEKMAKLRNAFLSSAAPPEDMEEEIEGAGGTGGRCPPPAFGSPPAGGEDTTMSSDTGGSGGPLKVSLDTLLEWRSSLVLEERLGEALSLEVSIKYAKLVASIQDQKEKIEGIAGEADDQGRDHENDTDILDRERNALESLQDKLNQTKKPNLLTRLPPPPPGHMTLAAMRATILKKCGLDKASSFAAEFEGIPLGDVARDDLSRAKEVQRNAIRWVRTLSLFEANQLERYGQAWLKAMQKMRYKMADAVEKASILADAVVSETEAVLAQAGTSPKVMGFVKGVEELYLTALKIEASSEAHPFCASGNSLEETRKVSGEVVGLWGNFRSLVATLGVEVAEVEIDAKGCWYTAEDTIRGDWSACCALTLLPIQLGTTESTVTWKGRRYLTSCANFWVHCVSEAPPYEPQNC